MDLEFLLPFFIQLITINQFLTNIRTYYQNHTIARGDKQTHAAAMIFFYRVDGDPKTGWQILATSRNKKYNFSDNGQSASREKQGSVDWCGEAQEADCDGDVADGYFAYVRSGGWEEWHLYHEGPRSRSQSTFLVPDLVLWQ